jgi:hypothetical protein
VPAVEQTFLAIARDKCGINDESLVRVDEGRGALSGRHLAEGLNARCERAAGGLGLRLRDFLTESPRPFQLHDRASAVPGPNAAPITGRGEFACGRSRGQNDKTLALRTRHAELMGRRELRLFHETRPEDSRRSYVTPAIILLRTTL